MSKGVGVEVTSSTEKIIRNVFRVLDATLQYWNFYSMEAITRIFCLILAGNYYQEFGYDEEHMEFLCTAQAYVEFDKAWPG